MFKTLRQKPSLKKQCWGLDIGANGAKLIELKNDGNVLSIENWAFLPFSSEIVQMGEIIKPQELVTILNLSVMRGSSSAVVTAIPDHFMMQKIISMPQLLEQRALEQQINSEVASYQKQTDFPIAYDFQILGKNAQDVSLNDVLLVMAHQQRVQDHCLFMQSLELSHAVVDVESFALERFALWSATQKDKADISFSQMPEFALAMGLALRGLEVMS